MLMDTRQLAAFCAVVERKSFSQAAERLGVTQPAVSLQIRSLEQRLGTQLLDRSGRRVEPTEAGLRLYASAQKLLALEEQLVAEVAGDSDNGLTGALELGASTGPGGTVVPILLCEFGELHPELHVRLSVSDTQTVVDQVADRELELGLVGVRLRELDVRTELGLQESVRSAVAAGHGVTFISRTALESELAVGTIATARVRGLDPVREIFLVRAAGRSETRAAHEFVAFAGARLPS